MSTVIVKKTELPKFLPHGWKKEAAKALGVHPNTIRNAILAGRGEMFEKVKKVAIEKWGE